jgi:hypothetical protein
MKADKRLVNYKTLILKNISDSKDKENYMLHCAEVSKFRNKCEYIIQIMKLL